MHIIRTLQELTEAQEARGSRGLGGVLVPTMGALHDGHAALIEHASSLARAKQIGPVVVSIFVNPTQFTDAADLARYPRTLDADLDVCRRAGASIIFAPGPETMYPPSAPVPVPPLPAAATEPGLEDAFRPGHFAGVCQVVMRLFELLRPEAAIFGEKDWQQLQVIRSMTREAGLPIEVIPHPTQRDADGVALSSRNRFLRGEERAQALAIPHALHAASQHTDPAAAETAMHRVLADAGLQIEYAVVRDAELLGPVRRGLPARALVAARTASVRLIDNAPWPGQPAPAG